MSDDLSKYLTDSKFIKFINAFKNYYWTKDLYDLHFLKKNCSELFKENLKVKRYYKKYT